MDDLIITNAQIVDGTGQPSFHGDVAVKDGRFTEVGKVGGSATRRIARPSWYTACTALATTRFV